MSRPPQLPASSEMPGARSSSPKGCAWAAATSYSPPMFSLEPWKLVDFGGESVEACVVGRVIPAIFGLGIILHFGPGIFVGT